MNLNLTFQINIEVIHLISMSHQLFPLTW